MLMQNFWGGGGERGGGGKQGVLWEWLYLTYENIHNTTRWKSAQTSYCRSIF